MDTFIKVVNLIAALICFMLGYYWQDYDISISTNYYTKAILFLLVLHIL